MEKLGLFLIVVLLPFVMCNNASSAAMQRNMLLVTMASDLSGGSTPGIYTYDNDSGTISLLIPYGENARWAPDHQKFAYIINGELKIYDIAKRKRYNSDCDLQYHNYWWTPNSDRIVYQISGTMANDQFGIAYRYIDNKYRSIDVWNKMKYEVGNVTFSNDADSIAFEAVNTIVSWGKIPKKLFVADMPFKSLQYAIRNEGIGELSNIIEIKPSADGAKYLVNPKWQPNGKLIAFDVVYDTQRQVWLFDTTTHVSSLLSANEYLTPETNSENAIPSAIGSKYTNMSMRVLDWSPDGSMLAVAIQMDNSKSDNGPVIIFNSTHKEMYYGSSLIQSGCIVNACFSLDNKMFATLRVPNPDYNIGSVDKYNILIRNIGTGKTDKIVQIPRGLRPLDIDW